MAENKPSRMSNKAKQDRQMRLAQALRKNLRRRKVPQAPNPSPPVGMRKGK